MKRCQPNRYAASCLCLLLTACLVSAEPKEKGREKLKAALVDCVAKANESTVRVKCDGKDAALGTIVSKDGFIITKGSELKGKIVCVLHSGKEFDALKRGYDKASDVGLLKIEADNLVPIAFSEDQTEVGTLVAAAGMKDEPIAVGVVSVKERKLYGRFAVVGNGNKGGLGIAPGGVEGGGVKIGQIIPKAAADKAGLKKDDVILEIAGKKTDSMEALVEILGEFDLNQNVEVKFKRNDEEKTITLKLSPRAAFEQNDPVQSMGGAISNRRTGFPKVIQHDTILKPVDCGGPLVDSNGKAIGMNIARAGRVETWALPTDVLLPIIKRLEEGKEVEAKDDVKKDDKKAAKKDENKKDDLNSKKSETKTEITPLEIINKSVEAHGGKEKLDKFKSQKTKFKGTLTIEGKDIDMTGESCLELPGKRHDKFTLDVGGHSVEFVNVVVGTNVTLKINGNDPPKALEDAQKEDMIQDVLMDEVNQMSPLLNDKKFTLKREKDETVDGKDAYVLTVTSKELKESKIFIDKKSGLLVKTVRKALKSGAQQDWVDQETFFTDFKKIDGIMAPTTVKILKDGEKDQEFTVTEIKFSEKADPKAFEIEEDSKQEEKKTGETKKDEKKKDDSSSKKSDLPIDKGAEIKGFKTVEGNPEGGLRYRVRVSEKATAEKPHRLVVWLHPSGGSMNQVVESMAPRLAEHGCALLVLTQKQYAHWSEEEAKQLVSKTLPDVGKTVKGVDVKKPFLMGFSAGGQVALNLWIEDPTAWGGLIVDAAYPVKREGNKHVLRELPKNDDLKKTPLLALVGTEDGGAAMWKKAEPIWHEAGVPLMMLYVEGKHHEWLFGKDQVERLGKWLDEVQGGKLPSGSVETKGEEKARIGVMLDQKEPKPTIAKVLKDGPAEKSGVKEGDIILKINGKVVDTPEEAAAGFGNLQPGKSVEIEVKRGDETVKLSISPEGSSKKSKAKKSEQKEPNEDKDK